MKNFTLKMLLLVATMFVIATSCQKEVQSKPVSVNDEPQEIKVQGKNGLVTLRLNKYSFEDIVKDEVNPSNEAINKEMLKVTNILKDFVANKELTRFIVASAKKQESRAVSVQEIANAFPEIASRLDKVESFGSTSATVFEHEGYTYEIGISVPNLDQANDELLPVLGVGLDLYDDVANNNPDLVFAYYTYSSGQQYQVNVGENEALQVYNPVCVAVPLLIGSPIEQNNNNNDNRIGQGGAQLRAQKRTFIETYLVRDRFDRSAHTEIHMAAAKPHTSNIDDRLIESMHGSQVGTQRNIDLTLRNDLIDDLIFNMYERDWYASRQSLGQTNNSGNEMRGRRSFFNEWYTFSPSRVNMNTGSSIWILNGVLFSNRIQNFSFDSQKGNMTLRFTQ